jgi:hypothetical protein
VVEIPDYYEYSFEYNYSLVLHCPNSKSFNIKFIVIDSNIDREQKVFFNGIENKDYYKRISEEKYYNVNNHVFEIDNGKLFVTSFEIIFKYYYINIRVNTLEKLEIESNNDLIRHIDEMILTIDENIS